MALKHANQLLYALVFLPIDHVFGVSSVIHCSYSDLVRPVILVLPLMDIDLVVFAVSFDFELVKTLG